MRKLVNLITKEISGLHEAAYLLGFSALTSQILALVRDRLFASQFGAGEVLDLYYASFRVPDLVFAVISSMVSVSILAPFLAKKMIDGEEATRKFLDSLFTVFSLLVITVCALLYFFMPAIVAFAFKGFTDQGLFTSLTRMLLLSPILLGMSNIFACVIQIKNRFTLSALSPVLYNVGIICGIILFFPIWGIHGLILGVILGALLHAMISIPYLFKERLMPRFSFNVDFGAIKDVVRLALPRSIALSASQITMFSIISFASFMATGSIAIFSLSFNLQAVPLAIIGASYSVAVFPRLSRLYAGGLYDEFLQKTTETIRHILFWSAPVVVLFIILKSEIVEILFGYGAFGKGDVHMTAMSLALFALAIIPQGFVLLLVRAMYAEGKTSKPLFINITTAFVTILLAYFGIQALKYFPNLSLSINSFFGMETTLDISVLVLPLAFALGSIINAALLLRAFSNENKSFKETVYKSAKKIFGASLVSGYASYLVLGKFEKWIGNDSALEMIVVGGLTTIIIGFVYFVALKAMKSSELQEIISTLKRKINKEEVVINGNSM